MDPLAQEFETYRANLTHLLGTIANGFVLIKGDRVIDTFTSIDDALKAGYEAFGNEPFLVKQVVEVELPQNFASFQISV